MQTTFSAHLLSKLVQAKMPERMRWYDDRLLQMASELADRLLPAFNTTSKIPHSRINLKRGLTPELRAQSDTCTACAGTIILEWAALSRLTGNPIYENKARKAMDFLWYVALQVAIFELKQFPGISEITAQISWAQF